MGYMASGKSFIGGKLAEKLDCNFIDLDTYIEQNEALKISEIFKTKGEIYFRKLESNALNDIIGQNQKLVLALGGGTPCYGDNMRTILRTSNCVSIYLQASVQTITERLKSEKDKRPLIAHLATDENLVEFVGKHLFERSSYYLKAQEKVIIDDLSSEEILEKIILKLF